MLHDRPNHQELLEIVAETLRDTVVPATAPHARHHARIAANLCAILAREVEHEPNDAMVLRRLEIELNLPVGHGGIAGIARALREGPAPVPLAVHDQVASLVQMKLAVDKPGHDAHDARAEADVVR